MSSTFNPKDYICVVGIDFGTTYSGCCFAFARDNNKDIEDITRWPRQNANFYPKTPTSLLYDIGGSTTETWGQNAHNTFWFSRGYMNKRLISRFKLLLNNDKSVPELPPGLTVEGVIRDYLKGFHAHIGTHIARTFGSLYDEKKLRYCLTVPASWTDHAKIIMRNAAIEAGLIDKEDHPDRLMLISEPEAAALYCQRHCEEFDLKHGQQFLICDAGGGTVDLVVFEIDESDGRRLKEITTAKGENCGSTFLDIRMQELLRKRIPKISPITLEEMTKAFIENHKPNFGDGDDEDNGIYFTIPGVLLRNGPEFLKSIGSEDNMLYFTYEELQKEVFEPVIERISDLIKKQLDYRESKKPMNAMFMVGGFSQSRYLERRIREKFSERIELISVAPRGELAIARGAVLLGLEPKLISQRIAKRTYGLQTRDKFDDQIDREEHRNKNPKDSEFCDVRFMPIVTKNQKLESEHYVSKGLQIWPTQPTRLAIYACDIDDYIPRWTISKSSNEVTKIGDFILRAPKVAQNHPKDSPIHMQVDFYFGKTEIKVETLVLGVTTTFTLKAD